MCNVRCFLLLLLAVLAGCSVTPKVKHATIEKELDPSETKTTLTAAELESLSGITYQATGSLLIIDEKTDNDQKPSGTLSIASVPIDADDITIYVVKPKAGNWTFTRTYLGASYSPNTRFLHALGVQVKDDRKQFVTALGSLFAVAGGLGTLGNGKATGDAIFKPIFPISLSAEDDLKDVTAPSKRHQEIPKQPFECSAIEVTSSNGTRDGRRVTNATCGYVTYGPLPMDAIRRKLYMDTVASKWTDTFPVPACRPATVEFVPWKAVNNVSFEGRTLSWPAVENVQLRTVVSDPLYVRVVKLPPKGSIDFHTSCGVDISVGDIATDPIWTAIAELGTQAKMIREAEEKAISERKEAEAFKKKKCEVAEPPTDCPPK